MKNQPQPRKRVRRLYAVIFGTHIRYVAATSDEKALSYWRKSASGRRVADAIVGEEVRIRLATDDEVVDWNAEHSSRHIPRSTEAV